MSNPFSNSNPFGGAGSFNPSGRQGSTGLPTMTEDEPSDAVTSPTNPSQAAPGGLFSANPAFGSGGFNPTQQDHHMPQDFNMNRRTSVSAESLTPSHGDESNWKPPFHPKSTDQLARLRVSVSNNFLFKDLDDDSAALVLGALNEKPIPAKDIKVITQGDAGDYFYVVERGSFDVYVNQSGTVEPGPNGMGNKVNSIGPGGSFGELALMYNAPRAATVVSTESNSTLWSLDRVTFRRILMDSAYGKRRMYEKFLEEVPLLSELTLYERSKIADALETAKFAPGTTIIQEGEPGEAFFFLEQGEADAYKSDVGGGTEVVKKYKKGDYFGELALLDDKPRAASVVASKDGEVKVAYLGKQGFQRLLGPVEAIMRRTQYR